MLHKYGLGRNNFSDSSDLLLKLIAAFDLGRSRSSLKNESARYLIQKEETQYELID